MILLKNPAKRLKVFANLTKQTKQKYNKNKIKIFSCLVTCIKLSSCKDPNKYISGLKGMHILSNTKQYFFSSIVNIGSVLDHVNDPEIINNRVF